MPKAPYKGNSGRYQRKSSKTYIRKNDKIRAAEIRVLDWDGKMLGVMEPAKALVIAKKAGLDLVEISSSAKPPVCKILDFGKYKYELSKKAKDQKQNAVKVKEVKFRISIEQHDYITKIRRAEEFLNGSAKVKLTLNFKGRQLEHKDLGFVTVRKAIKDLEHIGVHDSEPKLVGRNITTILSPVPEHKRRLIYNTVNEDEDE